MDNPSAEAGFEYLKRDTNSTIERHRVTNEDKKRLDSWLEEDADLGQLDIRKIKGGRDYALFAFWLLTVKLNKADAFHRLEAYYFLTKKYEIVSVSPQAFSLAVAGDDKEVHFRKSGDKHFLTSESIALVESWCSGAPVGGSIGDKKNEHSKSTG